jgi:hypothetical protein
VREPPELHEPFSSEDERAIHIVRLLELDRRLEALRAAAADPGLELRSSPVLSQIRELVSPQASRSRHSCANGPASSSTTLTQFTELGIESSTISGSPTTTFARRLARRAAARVDHGWRIGATNRILNAAAKRPWHGGLAAVDSRYEDYLHCQTK